MMPLDLWAILWIKTLIQDFYIRNILVLFNVLLRQSDWMMARKRVHLRLYGIITGLRTIMVNHPVGFLATSFL